jgi:tetratricopeptide (TPR) repeat protein
MSIMAFTFIIPLQLSPSFNRHIVIGISFVIAFKIFPMNSSELNKQYGEICKLIADRKVHSALSLLRPLTDQCRNVDISDQWLKLTDTYQNLLKYSFAQYEDPEKEKIYYRLLSSCLELADKTKENLIVQGNLLSYSRIKREFETKVDLTARDSSEIVETIAFENEINTILSNIGAEQQGGALSGKKIQQHQLARIFNMLWLSDHYREPETELVKGLCFQPVLPWYEKCLTVSAITLGLLRYFDLRKFELLFQLYERKEDQVWQRALAGLVIAFYIYDKRIRLYPELIARIDALRENLAFARDFENIYIQVIKSKETEKITKKFQEEIYPEVMKLRPRLEEKLDLDNILSDNFTEDKNPDWESLIGNTPGLFEKLEEFSMLQMEGADVFLSAFAMLKQFDFFREFGNWFLPFYKDNPVIKESLEGIREDFDVDSFVTGLEKSAFLCNSDKYSFCLNINRMPALQKSMMMQMFNMELNAMNEISREDEILNQSTRNRAIFTQYFQDLYRFYKLYPIKYEFPDIFNLPFDLHNTELYSISIDNDQLLRNIGEFYFAKDYYPEALEIFLKLDSGEDNIALWQKIAYAYQKTDDFVKALEYYKRAELVVKDSLWTIKKIAWCYRKLKNYNKALEYYQEAERLEPEDLHTQTHLGHTALDLKDYSNALKYYYKVEYLAPDNLKIQRPIAWCSFALGKMDVAKKYFEFVIAREGNAYDHMNLGHVDWCLKNKQQAIEHYKTSIRLMAYDFDTFSGIILDDAIYLEAYGIGDTDIHLMLDLLKFSLENEGHIRS